MYTSKEPDDHQASYLRLVHEMLESAPGARPFIDSINNRILTGDLYKALKETRKLIAYEKEHLKMQHASKAYAKVAKETAGPRELEASLLLKAAAKLQAVHDSLERQERRAERRTCCIIAGSGRYSSTPCRGKTTSCRAPSATIITNLGAFVLGETFSLMTKPKPNHLKSIIKINRGIAAGLRGKA